MFNHERIVMEPELEKDVNTKKGTKKIKIEKLFDFEPRGYYVYVHRKMTNGEIFYVGKGKGDRGWRRSGRNLLWNHKARKHGVNVEIVLDNLTEDLSLELERELIGFFGRISENDGNLANVQSIGNENPGASGLNNPKADKRVYHFVNIHTLESYIGTRSDFKKYKGIDLNPLFKRKILSHFGWTTMDTLSVKGLDALRNPKLGKYNGKMDKTEFNFYNMETRETLTTTQLGFKEYTGFSCGDIIHNRVMTVKDWCLYENKHKWYSMQKDYTEYLFVHQDGRQIIGTRDKFTKTTGVDTQKIFCRTRRNFTTKGWRVIK